MFSIYRSIVYYLKKLDDRQPDVPPMSRSEVTKNANHRTNLGFAPATFPVGTSVLTPVGCPGLAVDAEILQATEQNPGDNRCGETGSYVGYDPVKMGRVSD